MIIPSNNQPVSSIFYANGLNVVELQNKTTQTIPDGMAVYLLGQGGSASEIYAFDQGQWVDEISGLPVTQTNLTGMVYLKNPSVNPIHLHW